MFSAIIRLHIAFRAENRIIFTCNIKPHSSADILFGGTEDLVPLTFTMTWLETKQSECVPYARRSVCHDS